MLRSLVGSEMCIRDRMWIWYKGRVVRRSLTVMEGTGPFFKTLTELSNDCLLYTSDAADDLLCVDLGGRRIIKKKN